MLGSQHFEPNFVSEIPDLWQFCEGDLLWELFQMLSDFQLRLLRNRKVTSNQVLVYRFIFRIWNSDNILKSASAYYTWIFCCFGDRFPMLWLRVSKFNSKYRMPTCTPTRMRKSNMTGCKIHEHPICMNTCFLLKMTLIFQCFLYFSWVQILKCKGFPQLATNMLKLNMLKFQRFQASTIWIMMK